LGFSDLTLLLDNRSLVVSFLAKEGYFGMDQVTCIPIKSAAPEKNYIRRGEVYIVRGVTTLIFLRVPYNSDRDEFPCH